jgi:DNA ligase-1
MEPFCRLLRALDASQEECAQLRVMEAYFRQTPAADAAWALHFLAERRRPGAIKPALLQRWGAAAAGWPAWLMQESLAAVGDLAETLALLLGPRGPRSNPSGPPLALSQTLAQFV